MWSLGLRVADLASTSHPYVLPDAGLGELRRIIRDQGLRVLPVVEDERTLRLLGLVERADLLLVSSTRSSARAADLASEPRLSLDPKHPAREALEAMLRADVWHAPVLGEARRYMGVLSMDGIVDYIVEREAGVIEPVAVGEVAERRVVWVEPDTPVYKVWQMMRSRGFSALPVVDKGRLVGVVAEYDLLVHGYTRPLLESDEPRRGPRVREVMSTPPVTVGEDVSLLEAARLMSRRGIGRVYVVDPDGRLLGVVDRSDVVSTWLRRR